MTWLVTGGAGYIGAHVARALLEAGLQAHVFDNLSTGRRRFIPDGATFTHGDILDTGGLARTIRNHQITGVIHVAGFKYAGVSVQQPLYTYRQNVVGTMSVLEAMDQCDVEQVVFSSSAAVYGTPDLEKVTESTPTRPQSPYGESKLIGEWLLHDSAAVTGLRQTSLRYFNVVGSGDPTVYDLSPHNLFPLVFDTLVAGNIPWINGSDYPTPDGTNVRDYVHVGDIAAAHVVAARRLAAGEPIEPAYNLGSGEGLSVAQILRAVASVTGYQFTPEMRPRRPGDPPRIVASGDLAARDLDWQVRHSVDEMVRSAWEARLRARVEPLE